MHAYVLWRWARTHKPIIWSGAAHAGMAMVASYTNQEETPTVPYIASSTRKSQVCVKSHEREYKLASVASRGDGFRMVRALCMCRNATRVRTRACTHAFTLMLMWISLIFGRAVGRDACQASSMCDDMAFMLSWLCKQITIELFTCWNRILLPDFQGAINISFAIPSTIRFHTS